MLTKMNLNMKTIEEWKYIKGFPDYEVSTFGQIRRNNKLLTPTKRPDGYLKINLRINKNLKLYMFIEL